MFTIHSESLGVPAHYLFALPSTVQWKGRVPSFLMGHQCETLLPVAGTFLRPQYSTEEETHALFGKKQRQQYYYNQLTKPQQAIGHGETVHMKLPGQKMWSAGTCMGQVGPLSYKVKVGESVYRHNCRNHPL